MLAIGTAMHYALQFPWYTKLLSILREYCHSLFVSTVHRVRNKASFFADRLYKSSKVRHNGDVAATVIHEPCTHPIYHCKILSLKTTHGVHLASAVLVAKYVVSYTKDCIVK